MVLSCEAKEIIEMMGIFSFAANANALSSKGIRQLYCIVDKELVFQKVRELTSSTSSLSF